MAVLLSQVLLYNEKMYTFHAKKCVKVVLMSHDEIESNTCDPVLLNVLNLLQERDKMLGSLNFLSLILKSSYKSNNT